MEVIEQIGLSLRGYKPKNRFGSAKTQFLSFLRLGIRIRLSIGKLNPQASIAITEDVFQNRQSVVD